MLIPIISWLVIGFIISIVFYYVKFGKLTWHDYLMAFFTSPAGIALIIGIIYIKKNENEKT